MNPNTNIVIYINMSEIMETVGCSSISMKENEWFVGIRGQAVSGANLTEIEYEKLGLVTNDCIVLAIARIGFVSFPSCSDIVAITTRVASKKRTLSPNNIIGEYVRFFPALNLEQG